MKIPIHVTPTLFVFLGTSSGEIGWRTKKLIQETYGDLPIIRYLWVDTDTYQGSESRMEFNESERVELIGFDIAQTVSNIHNFPTVLDWFPEETSLRGKMMHRGTPQQMRLAGRLALFRMFTEQRGGSSFIGKLKAATSAITQIQNLNDTANYPHEAFEFQPDKDGAHVYVIFSTCGGTGSSISFDIANLCRYLLRAKNPMLFGLSMLPSVIEIQVGEGSERQRNKNRANTYAWFKEDQFLRENPPWYVNYPDGSQVREPNPPFDIHYLIDLMNQDGQSLNSFNDAAQMAAWALFMGVGGNIAGSLNSYTEIVGGLDGEFSKRITPYSSFATAAMIYPIEKLKKYCGAKLAGQLIKNGLMAVPDNEKINNSVQSFIAENKLNDIELVNSLKSDFSVDFLEKPILLTIDSIERALAILDRQFNSGNDDIVEIERDIVNKASKLQSSLAEKLENAVTDLAITQGLPSAERFINQLMVPMQKSKDGYSFDVYLNKVSPNKYNPEIFRKEYQDAYGKVRNLQGGVDDTIRGLFPRRQATALKLAIIEAVKSLENFHREQITYYARREAANIYNHLIGQLNQHQAALSSLNKSRETISTQLDEEQKKALIPAGERDGLFDLSRELLCEKKYFEAFYKTHVSGIDTNAVYFEFAEKQTRLDTLTDLRTFFDKALSKEIVATAGESFQSAIDGVSLLSALQEFYGDEAPKIIENEFDNLIKYAVPFWSYDRNMGHKIVDGKTLVGVEDANSKLVPDKVRNNNSYELKSTGLKHYILLLTVQHANPAFILRGMDVNQQMYKMYSTEGTLHALPNMEMAKDVFPDMDTEARITFALANVFGFIAQVGHNFYFDEARVQKLKELNPALSFKFASGRENAENRFIHHTLYLSKAEELIEKHIAEVGNQKACEELSESIAQLQEKVSDRNISRDLSDQLSRELKMIMEYKAGMNCS